MLCFGSSLHFNIFLLRIQFKGAHGWDSVLVLVFKSRMILSFLTISAWNAAALAVDSWSSFSREEILLRRDSRALSFSVRESRIVSLAMMLSMSAWLAGGFLGGMAAGEEGGGWGLVCEREGDGLSVCWQGMRGEGGVGGGGSAAGVCRSGVQATCHWGCSHDPTTCCVG